MRSAYDQIKDLYEDNGDEIRVMKNVVFKRIGHIRKTTGLILRINHPHSRNSGHSVNMFYLDITNPKQRDVDTIISLLEGWKYRVFGVQDLDNGKIRIMFGAV